MRMLVQIKFHFTLIAFYNALHRTNVHGNKALLILTRGLEDLNLFCINFGHEFVF
jgi:hypothetical protein